MTQTAAPGFLFLHVHATNARRRPPRHAAGWGAWTDITEKYLALVDRIRAFGLPKDVGAQFLAEVEAIFRQERADGEDCYQRNSTSSL